MHLRQLSITRVRNITNCVLKPSATINLICGENGSGKTSILESIQILSLGRSFRTVQNKSLIQQHEESLLVLADVEYDDSDSRIGIELSKKGTRARINQQSVKTLFQLSQAVPVQAIHPASFSLLAGEPEQRRRFIDWGVVYQNENFVDLWKRYKSALEQRNAALRSRQSEHSIRCWDSPIADAGEAITQFRKNYFKALSAEIIQLLPNFVDISDLKLEFRQGWSQEVTLSQALTDGIERDRKQGFTYPGSHRADFRVKTDGLDVAQYGSRGQIKRAVLLLKLAQIKLFKKINGDRCILLVDDLLSEFDENNVAVFMELFTELGLQTFFTSANEVEYTRALIPADRMFHVKHGKLQEMI